MEFVAVILLTCIATASALIEAYSCGDGKTLASPFFCDGRLNCANGSDEVPANFSTYPDNPTSPYISCDNKLNSNNKVCALQRQEFCKQGIPCINKTMCDGGCPSYFQCPKSSCLERSTVCDGDPCNDCPTFQNWNNGHGFKCVRNGRLCNLPQMLLWDGIADCDDKSDLCYSKETGDSRDMRSLSSFNITLCFQCLDEATVISKASVCDGVVDCPDKSDECLCEQQKPEKCGVFVRLEQKKAKECSSPEVIGAYGEWECVRAVNLTHKTESNGTWSDKHSKEHFVRKLASELLCDGKVDCHEGDLRNNSLSNETFANDEDPGLCKHRHHCTTNGGLRSIPRSSVCDGIVNCLDKSDEYPEEMCERRFYCSAFNGTKISISMSEFCDFVINCDDQSDETNCTNDGRFYCENKQPLFVKKEKKFNGFGDCWKWSDECPTETASSKKNRFSVPYARIFSPRYSYQRGWVWAAAFMTLFGNLFVIVTEFRVLLRTESQSAASRTNHLLVLNLSVSDLLMGVYLLMLGAAGARYSENYCANDLAWRSSGTCTAMGVLFSISSETSVLTMGLLTAFRFFAVENPFDVSLRPKLTTVVLSIISSWTFSLILALIPLMTQFQHFYETKAWMDENPFFSHAAVDFSKMEAFMKQFVTLQYNLSSNDSQVLEKALFRVNHAYSWNDYMDILEEHNYTDLFKISGYLGYYSTSSVCIGKLFVTPQDKAWMYSIGIVTLNFLVFVFVAIAYVWIYKKSTASSRKVNENPEDVRKAKKNKEMQKRIFLLIFTDFTCWVPVSIVAFVSLGGVSISPVMYTISMIALQMNNILNPLIYCNALKRICDQIDDRIIGAWRRLLRVDVAAAVANRENA